MEKTHLIQTEIDSIYDYLNELNVKYPEFNSSGWIPPTQRNRKDNTGSEYRSMKWNKSTKTVWYEIKLTPNDRWSGPYHGRTWSMFLNMKEV